MTEQIPGHKARTSPQRNRITLYVFMTALALLFVLPLLSMFSTSFKSLYEANTTASLIPKEFTLDNYRPLFSWTGNSPVMRWFANSVIVSVITTVLSVSFATLAAYAITRFKFPGRKLIFGALLVTMFVPGFVFLIPNYVTIDRLGLLDNLVALILPSLGGAFGVIFLSGFFMSLPKELEEAAAIDGANAWQVFRSVMLPQAQGAISTLSVLVFLGAWNDLLWPTYVLFSSEKLTLTAGLPLLQSANAGNLPLAMAGSVISAVPALIVFVLAQRKIIESVASVGLKG